MAQLTAGAVAIALGLSACGGDSATPVATPSGSGSGGETSPSGHFSAAFTVQVDRTSGAVTRQLQVVNLDTHSVVRTYKLTNDGLQHVLSTRFAMTSSTEAQLLGPSHVFMVQAGRIQKVDLRGPVLGQTTQVSTLSTACRFASSDVEVFSAEGDAPWLEVVTAGADGQCATEGDNTRVLVQGNMTLNTLPVRGGPSGVALLSGLDGSVPGLATGLLGWDRATNKLGVYSPDFKYRTQDVPTPGVSIQANSVVKTFGYLANDPRTVFLQVDTSVYLVRYVNNQVSLTRFNLTLDDASITPTTAAHGQDTFLLANNGIYKVGSTGALTFVTDLLADAGTVEDLVVVGDSVVVNHLRDDVQPQVYTVVSYPLDGSAGRMLTSTDTASVSVLGPRGADQVVVLERDTTTGWAEVKLYPLGEGDTVTALSAVHMVGATLPERLALSTQPAMAQMVFCQPAGGVAPTAPGSMYCAGHALYSMDLATGDTRLLGSLPAEPTWPNSFGVNDGLTLQRVAGQLTTVTLALTTSSAGSSKVWQFNPSVANSLVLVNGTP